MNNSCDLFWNFGYCQNTFYIGAGGDAKKRRSTNEGVYKSCWTIGVIFRIIFAQNPNRTRELAHHVRFLIYSKLNSRKIDFFACSFVSKFALHQIFLYNFTVRPF